MKPILLKDISDNLEKEVKISGWLFNKRSSGKIHFLQIRDGTGFIQAVVSKSDVSEKTFSAVESLTLESSLHITGKVKKEPRSPSGFEMFVEDLIIVQLASDDYPIGKKDHGPKFLLDNRHLWLRSPRQRAIQLIRNEIIRSINDYYFQQGFTRIDTPIITPSACEGTTTLFEVDYFGQPSYLSQSGQLYLEAAIFSVGRCFDFAPVFRAEKSKTRRHLIEFWMTNVEAAFVDHEQNLKIQEGLLVYILKNVLENRKEELNVLDRDIGVLENISAPFQRLAYKESIKILHKLGSDIKDGEDFGNDDETILMNHYKQPVFVEFYPAKVKAFYMKRHPQHKELALCADLLAPEGYGEIIGGSQREDDYDLLLQSIKTHDLAEKDFHWYLDLRKYGSVPHSGFGLGLERVLAWICGLKHVRETIPFPRLINRFKP